MTRTQQGPGPRTRAFFRDALRRLADAGVPFLIGGAYAFERYTGIPRHTRDLDIFVKPEDCPRVLELFAAAGLETSLPFPHWLGKVYKGRTYIDIIFSSGNGVARVDDEWFVHGVPEEVFGVPVRLCPAEEIIWSKAFIMERERFDGADIQHLFLARAEQLDWHRLLARFGPNSLVLFVHVALFSFVYPGETERIPAWVRERLSAGLQRNGDWPDGRVCRGTLLSRTQYLVDVQRGFADVRLADEVGIGRHDLATWTEAAVTEKASGIPEDQVTNHARDLRETEDTTG